MSTEHAPKVGDRVRIVKDDVTGFVGREGVAVNVYCDVVIRFDGDEESRCFDESEFEIISPAPLETKVIEYALDQGDTVRIIIDVLKKAGL